MTSSNRALVEKLLAAISWLDEPFIDDSTSREELMKRIRFMRQDRDRALAAVSKPLEGKNLCGSGAEERPSRGSPTDCQSSGGVE